MDASTFQLTGTKDMQTGEVFFPPRVLSADGALRELEEITLSSEGTLYSYAVVGDKTYGLIDLPEGVRLQTELSSDEPVIGSAYRLVGDESGWSFGRA